MVLVLIVFSHDVMAAMLVSQTKPLGIAFYFYANSFFYMADSHVSENALLVEKVARVLLANHMANQYKTKANAINIRCSDENRLLTNVLEVSR